MSIRNRICIREYKRVDEDRGWFQKPLTRKDETTLPEGFGEIYFVKALSGQVRGNHYHLRATEWFIAALGTATVYLEDVDSGERISVELAEQDNICLRVSPRIAHVFVNKDDKSDFILVAYTDQQYLPEDTVPFHVDFRSEM